MPNPELNVRAAASISPSDIADKFMFDSNTLHDGKMKLNGNTYRVAFSRADGEKNVSVSVRREYTGLFSSIRNRWSNRQTTHAMEIQQRFQELLGSKEFVVVKNSYFKLLDIARQNPGQKTIEVANYGLKNNRNLLASHSVLQMVNDKLAATTQQKIIFNKIDDYNTLVGITPESFHPKNYGKLMQDIASNQLTTDQEKLNNASDRFSEQQLQEWKSFLSRPEIMQKIDIPRKLYDYMHQDPLGDGGNVKQTGMKADFRSNPDQALRNFVIKNTPRQYRDASDDLVSKVTAKLKDYVEIYHLPDGAEKNAKLQEFLKPDHWYSKADVEAYSKKYKVSFDEAKRACKNNLLNSPRFLYFCNVLSISTFRQTSKLGLEFFQNKKSFILFQYADYQKKDLRHRLQPEIVGENFWKEGHLNAETGGSIITHSELRHAKRLQTRLGDEFRIRLAHGA